MDDDEDDAADEEALGTAAVSPGHDASARQVLARAVAGALDIIGTDADAAQKRRPLELHCYFSHFALEDAHLFSALYGVMKVGCKQSYFAAMAVLCRRLLELSASRTSPEEAASAKRTTWRHFEPLQRNKETATCTCTS